MLHVLTHNILPVFALLALGFALGRAGTMARAEAVALNRFAFLVLQPPLLFLLMTGLDLPSFDVPALGLYVACQVSAFLLALAAARLVFRRDPVESFLLAMAVIFVNTLLYIWPIAVLIYGEARALPVTAIVAWDSAVSFPFFIVAAEILTGKGTARATLKRIARNPVILSILAGLALNLSGLPVPEPVITAARFAGAAAAPVTLFALGVILSGHALAPSPTVAGIAAMKLLLFPALVFAALTLVLPGSPWRPVLTLGAAGPSGAMAFSLALLYGVRTDAIAPVIIWTSLLSLLSLAYLA
ncbi:AEC family transporter [Oceaniglobus roseus]|uniref:AEC family transporter n=1 Tax=Oceaniglobus roseus TaxID=1737570 RepID=UPI000C7F4E17|nr:AEC family transporter [Kandeliimicrobium roseum]